MQIVGIFALVGSLIFVGLQMKQTQEIAAFESLTAGADRGLAFRALLAENADAWAKGCNGEKLTDEERTRFASVFEAFSSNYYTAWARAQTDDFNTLDSTVFIRRYAINLYRFPALAAYAADRNNWLGPKGTYQDESVVEYRTLIVNERARLAEEGQEFEYDVSKCGI